MVSLPFSGTLPGCKIARLQNAGLFPWPLEHTGRTRVSVRPAGAPAAEPTAEPSLLSGAPHPGSAELCSPTAAAAVGSVALCSPGTTAGASAAAYSSGAENPATDTGPATATDSSTAQHAAGEPTRDADAAEAAAAGSTAGTGAGPAEPLKSCNLCCTQFPRSEFKVLSGGRRASYCVKCTSYVCQGRTRRLSIHDLRRAMKSNELETLLRGEAPLPADHKRCQLCAEVLELSNFRQLPRGGHESYCGTCSKYVRRGTKLGLNIEGVRKAREVRCAPLGSPAPCMHVHVQTRGAPRVSAVGLCLREQGWCFVRRMGRWTTW